ncbi:hypothetical protein [Candidatus Palauibacter sp.]|uniref:hypothetical protein n=1 Tax=Candidatus Palauibacter sp. TaxID=3101350 RepID=UPI003CC5B160
MKRFGIIVVLTFGLMAGVQPLRAQEVGDRVRVTTAGGMVVGRVVGMSGDGFDLGLSGGGSGSFTRVDVVRLERSLGTSSAWKRGLLYGGAGGALVGFTIARTLITATCDVVTLGTATEECSEEGFGVALASGAIWGAIGGVLGMGVGALIRGPESWEDIAFGGMDAAFSPILDLRLDRGQPSAVLGARLRL